MIAEPAKETTSSLESYLSAVPIHEGLADTPRHAHLKAFSHPVLTLVLAGCSDSVKVPRYRPRRRR
jgi:hypothetical protein